MHGARVSRDPARRGCGAFVPPESGEQSWSCHDYNRGYHGGAAYGCTCHPCSAAPTQSRRSTSAWCASTASARRRCLVPSGDTCVHEPFRRAASMSPRGSTVQPCAAAPCHRRSSISSSVKDCGDLPRAPEDSVAEDAAAATGSGAAVVVEVREECRDIFRWRARAAAAATSRTSRFRRGEAADANLAHIYRLSQASTAPRHTPAGDRVLDLTSRMQGHRTTLDGQPRHAAQRGLPSTPPTACCQIRPASRSAAAPC